MSISETEYVNTIIKAGAGAGKTYGLIHKIVDLVREYAQKNNGELPRFVVTTFTRKATQELRERLLLKALEIRRTDPQFGELLLKFLKTSGLLLISTIHGVLNQFLRTHGSLIGLDRQFQITKSPDKLITELLHQQLETQPELSSFVVHYGWSKLRSLFLEYHRASMFNPDLMPFPESLLTDYWQQQLHRINGLAIDLEVSVSKMMLSKKTETLGKLQKSLEALKTCLQSPENVWVKLEGLHQIRQDFPVRLGSLANWEESAKTTRQELMDCLNEITDNPWIDPTKIETHFSHQQQFQELAKGFSHLFIKRKIESAEIELEDLEFLSLYLLRNNKNEVKAFSENWNYWFIDEYQDTSPIQVEILERLIGICPHYVVGDPQQSIYFFRGARSKVFNEKLEFFKKSGALVEIKTVNRRSLSPTLFFINDLMDLVNKHQFTPMTSTDSNASSNLMVGHFYLVPEDEEKHLDILVQSLEKLLSNGTAPSQIALLCRENREILKVFTKLESASIPAKIFSQGQFVDDREVRDALCLWHFLVNPYDNENLVELLRSPHFRVRDEIITSASTDRNKDLWSSLSEINDLTIRKLSDALQRINLVGHIEAWQEFIMNSTLLQVCTAKDMGGRKEGNIWKLLTQIQESARCGTLDYTDPLNLKLSTEVSNEGEASSIRETDQIQIMTIHASKGLEFDHVFIPFLNHQKKKESAELFTIDLEGNKWSLSMQDESSGKRVPSFFSRGIANETYQLLQDEDERLFYVAITRAKKSLHFFPPESQEHLSDTGWARHLSDFTKNGIGQFKSKDNGSYEFTVESLSQLEAPKYSPKNIVPSEVTTIRFSDDKITQLRSLSVTSLLSSSVPTLSNTRVGPIEVTAISKGVSTHKKFESFGSSKSKDLLPPELQSFIDKADIPFEEIVTNGFVEWPFSFKFGTHVIDGQIDLWGRDLSNNVWIVDYKTGSPKFSEKAVAQMKIYAWSLKAMNLIKANDSIRLAVCYPYHNQTIVKVFTASELEAPKVPND